MRVLRKFKDYKYRLFFVRKEFSKLILKSFLSSFFFVRYEKLFFQSFFYRFSLRSSISFFKRSCSFTRHARAISRLFKFSRHKARFLASNGLLVGLRKSSF